MTSLQDIGHDHDMIHISIGSNLEIQMTRYATTFLGRRSGHSLPKCWPKTTSTFPPISNSRLLTGGLTHTGAQEPPPIQVYGYEFGEDPFDP